ncbi:amyloid-beta A4 precursor protein-binding family A member 1-like isoform X1 [Bolinopsis microptera]|uniref:amyloid-beta A4 precursor protein-binding family A member 1-like isoform X1 n=1 Tax=Bolinopsis microptera TaxID=2820187 RepID=UPI00307980BA
MMKSEGVHFPVETIRSALSKFNKKNDNSDSSKKVALLSHDDSADSGDESYCEKKNLLLRDVTLGDLSDKEVRPCYQEDTDSDVSDDIFNERDNVTALRDYCKTATDISHDVCDSPGGSCRDEEAERVSNRSETPETLSSNQVILYQSIEDGSIALKADDDIHEDKGYYKDFYTDTEILSGVSFKMKYLGSTPITPVKYQVDDVRGHQAQEAVNTIVGTGNSKKRPSNPVIFTVSASKLLVYDGNMQQLLMEHPIKLVSYVGDVGSYLVVMVRYQNHEEKQVFRVTCHVFQSKHSHQVRAAMNKAFTLSYNDVIRKSGQNEETLLQCAYSEVLSCQKRAEEDIADLLDSSKHNLVSIIKRPQEGLGLSLIPSGPGSIIPTIIVSSIKPASPSYKTEQLNVGDQILEINKRSLCGLTYEETLSFIKSLLSTTKLEFKVVPGSPVLVVELIRPDLKYPLGFSVKDGHITTLIRGSIGERAGIRIGHRIIAINEESTVTSDHDTIAGILLSETGRLVLKTMPSPIFDLMLGYETPLYL